MQQLPLFVNVDGRKVIVAGDGAAADAKRRLVKRAGGGCVDEDDVDARIAFVAVDNPGEAEALADQLRARGLLVNVVDRPELCDFTTPAIVDRSPVLIAISTGGASAGMAKALRQRIEAMLPARLGALASAMASAREAIRTRWPDPTDRRAAIDCAFEDGGVLDPLADGGAVDDWLAANEGPTEAGLITIDLLSNDPDDLTLKAARLLGRADIVWFDTEVDPAILDRARADAVRRAGAPEGDCLAGLNVYLRLAPEKG